MRACYTAANNEGLVASAIRLQWIETAIDIHPDDPTWPRGIADLSPARNNSRSMRVIGILRQWPHRFRAAD